MWHFEGDIEETLLGRGGTSQSLSVPMFLLMYLNAMILVTRNSVPPHQWHLKHRTFIFL